MTPFFAVSNAELASASPVKRGDKITCPRCNKSHTLRGCKRQDGTKSDTLLVYQCGKSTYLGAVDGKLIIDRLKG